ncbi:MAG TPA: deoxyribonuclease HsdR, partial [Paludibacter sp.]
MKASKRMKMLGFFGLVVAVSVATNLTTNYVASKQSDGFKGQENQIPAAYAKFSKVSSGLETDFTVAAELSVHAVVHVKTKTPVKVQQFGGGFP